MNNNLVVLPYESKRENVFVIRKNYYIVFETNFFKIYFDGDQMMKLYQCNDIICGICGNNNGNPLDDFINRSRYILHIPERGCSFNF